LGAEPDLFDLALNLLPFLLLEISSLSIALASLLILLLLLISNNLFNIAIVIVSDYVLGNMITGEICAAWATSLIETFPYQK